MQDTSINRMRDDTDRTTDSMFKLDDSLEEMEEYLPAFIPWWAMEDTLDEFFED